jgi:hypothetical protein
MQICRASIRRCRDLIRSSHALIRRHGDPIWPYRNWIRRRRAERGRGVWSAGRGGALARRRLWRCSSSPRTNPHSVVPTPRSVVEVLHFAIGGLTGGAGLAAACSPPLGVKKNLTDFLFSKKNSMYLVFFYVYSMNLCFWALWINIELLILAIFISVLNWARKK